MKKMAVAAVLVALGCAAEKPGPEPESTRRVVVATFTGEIDRVAGTFTIRTEPTAAGRALGMASLAVDTNVTVANNPGTVWNNADGHCTVAGPSTGAEVIVTSNFAAGTTRLDNIWAVIDTMTPATGLEACNSTTDPAPLGITPTNLGVWHYGDLVAGAASAAQEWAFKWVSATDSSIFSGHIYASTVDARTNVAPNPVLPGSAYSTVMTGTADKAVFLDGIANRVRFVSATGAATQSNVLGGTPNGVAVNLAGTEAWVAESDANRIDKVTISTGVVTGVPTNVSPWFEAAQYITVDPNGVVWFSGGLDQMNWFDPVAVNGGTVILPGGAVAGPMVAVDRGGACYVYVEDTVSGDIYRVDCATKVDGDVATVAVQPECIYATGMHTDLVAGPNGTAWFVGPVVASGAPVCQIQDATAFLEFGIPFVTGEVLGFTYGPDGNFGRRSTISGAATSSHSSACGSSTDRARPMER